jgi:plasmid stabilization system protein ParE
MKIKISESAYRDLANGFAFYELQEKDLGTYFQDSLFADIDSLKLYAGIHSIHLDKYRLLSKRFPYSIYYIIKNNTAIISAILDCRRNPKWIKHRLK